MLASNQKILPEKTLIIFVKIYLVDVGLLRRLAQLAPTAFSDGNSLFTEFKLSIYLLKKAVHKSQNLHTAFYYLSLCNYVKQNSLGMP